MPPNTLSKVVKLTLNRTPVAGRMEARLQGMVTACPSSKNRSYLSDGPCKINGPIPSGHQQPLRLGPQ